MPFTPADDAQVLERNLRARDTGPENAGGIDALRRVWQRDPQDLAAALAFARRAIALGSEEADPREYGYAQAALAPWWQRPDPPIDVRLLRATILQWRHDFAAAVADLDAIVQADREGVEQARLTRASIELVQGDPLAARRDCAALIGHTDLLTATACIASANARLGRARAMLDALRPILDQAKDAPVTSRVWGETEVAEIAVRLGDAATAEAAYRTALALMQTSGHRDPYLLASASDFDLDRKRPQDVVARLAGLARIDNLFLRLALAKQQLAQGGDAQAARDLPDLIEQLQSRFDETRARGDFVHQREEALFLLELRHDVPGALRAARQNWQAQREPMDARLLLQAAAQAGDVSAAQPVLDWMRRTQIEDVQLDALAKPLQAAPP